MTPLVSAAPARSRLLARGPLARAALSTAVAAVLVSCGSGSSDGADDAGRSPSGPSSRTSSAAPTPPSPSPDPTLPDPADGTKTELCRDGHCEVRVTQGATVPVPERSGVGRLQVTGIKGRTVTLTAPMIQSQYSSDGGCEMSITGPSANSPGSMDLTCQAGAKGVINKLHLQVVGVVDTAAVLRIGPETSDPD